MDQRFKIVFFPLGEYDAAGTKRIKNLSKYLQKGQNITCYILNLKTASGQRSTIGVIKNLYKFCLFCINLLCALYILFREKEIGSRNILYFYEGENMLFHRLIIARLLGYKILVDLVEDPHAFNKNWSLTHKISTYYFLFIYRLLPLFAHGIIVVSSYLKNKVKEDHKGKIPVCLLPVSYDADDFKLKPRKFSGKGIFYGGSFGINYDFDSLFTAFNSLSTDYPELKLYLSGKINRETKEMIANKIVLKENIVYCGFLPEKEYYQTICGMDILCMPRIDSVRANAGFPFKLAEYLATGKPVLVSRVSDIEEYLTNNDAYLFEPGDHEKIEIHLREVLSHQEKALIIGNNGKNKAQEFFDASIVSRYFMEFIDELY